MAHVGQVKDKITVEVTLLKEHTYTDYSFSYYGTPKSIYIMKDADDNTFVWKTGSCLSILTDEVDSWGDPVEYFIKKGDKFQIKGTIKAHSEYNDEPQTVLNRVKVVKLIEKALTYEEIKQMKQEEQLATLQEDDFIWEMPYKQYKSHYADCETLYGSYDKHEELIERTRTFHPATIKVIIRAGRVKNSGVRGEHFSGYEMTNELGEKVTYRAVCEENALKRVQKEFPDNTWECTKVYNYQSSERFSWY